MIIQDAKYMATGELYLYDRGSAAMSDYIANRLLPYGGLPANLLQNRCTYAAGGLRLGYDFGADEVLISIDIDGASSNPPVKARLTLDVRRASPPLVVSALLPGGKMYTNKIIYPASGTIVWGERRYEFDPARDFAILDEHKSHLPYHTDWDWGTFAMPVDGHIVGANLANRPEEPGQQEESCIWTPDAALELSDITFTQTGDDDAPWKMVSADGRVDVTFTPQGHKGQTLNLGVVAMDYAQWFGHYNGTIGDGKQVWPVENVPGVCERMHARF